DTQTMQDWEPTTTALIMASQHLREVAQFRPDTIESQIQQLRDLKQSLWVMSEFAGRERAGIGSIIDTGAALDPQTLERLANFRGQVDLAWSQVQAYVASEKASPVIRQETRAVE